MKPFNWWWVWIWDVPNEGDKALTLFTLASFFNHHKKQPFQHGVCRLFISIVQLLVMSYTMQFVPWFRSLQIERLIASEVSSKVVSGLTTRISQTQWLADNCWLTSVHLFIWGKRSRIHWLIIMQTMILHRHTVPEKSNINYNMLIKSSYCLAVMTSATDLNSCLTSY